MDLTLQRLLLLEVLVHLVELLTVSAQLGVSIDHLLDLLRELGVELQQLLLELLAVLHHLLVSNKLTVQANLSLG